VVDVAGEITGFSTEPERIAGGLGERLDDIDSANSLRNSIPDNVCLVSQRAYQAYSGDHNTLPGSLHYYLELKWGSVRECRDVKTTRGTLTLF
ncbi:MAG: hypothetical protein P8J33_16090, partial [Pirellulaceae bacterium]|nr:hypothetical protein [Pirellulaceae bacterium]